MCPGTQMPLYMCGCRVVTATRLRPYPSCVAVLASRTWAAALFGSGALQTCTAPAQSAQHLYKGEIRTQVKHRGQSLGSRKSQMEKEGCFYVLGPGALKRPSNTRSPERGLGQVVSHSPQGIPPPDTSSSDFSIPVGFRPKPLVKRPCLWPSVMVALPNLTMALCVSCSPLYASSDGNTQRNLSTKYLLE